VHKTRLALVKKEVNKIIVPSFTTKEDVVKLGITEDKITVIPEAADESIKRVNNEEINHIKNKYRISGNYLLAVGVNPRKNTERIIKAFEKVRSGKNDLKLVFIGHSHGSVPNLRNIIFTGHVFTEELSAFYSGAEALIYPSIYEGFGLPVLEAYVCGIPVVTSNISSLTEVAGKAAIMVDPFNVDSMADGINKALRGKYGLVKKGYIEAKKYNWEKTALATLAVYNNAVNER
jgi:glycosyltransferase involved in cell wall biosynthesis